MDRKLDSRLPPAISGRSGVCGARQYLAGGLGQALESTMRPVHFESVQKIGRARLLSVCLSLATGWRTRTAVTIRGALAKDFMAQAAARQ